MTEQFLYTYCMNHWNYYTNANQSIRLKYLFSSMVGTKYLSKLMLFISVLHCTTPLKSEWILTLFKNYYYIYV